jgi:hypothetical protein
MLDLAKDHFDRIQGTESHAASHLNWEGMGLSSMDLADLELPFLLEEIKRAIDDMPVDQGQMGFREAFSVHVGILLRVS